MLKLIKFCTDKRQVSIATFICATFSSTSRFIFKIYDIIYNVLKKKHGALALIRGDVKFKSTYHQISSLKILLSLSLLPVSRIEYISIDQMCGFPHNVIPLRY